MMLLKVNSLLFSILLPFIFGNLPATGLECANRTSSRMSNRTMDLGKLRRRTQNLLDTTVQNSVNNSTINMLLNITSETDSVTNTSTPLEPNDILITLDILQDVLNISTYGEGTFRMDSRSMRIVNNCAMILNTMLDERQDDSFETLIECQQQTPPVGERLLSTIERVGIFVAITFDTSQNKTSNHRFNESHIIIDALLPSDDDLMNNDDFTFQISRHGQNNIPLLGIRIPSRVVQNRGRIPIVNIFIFNIASKLQNDEGKETASAILSTQISISDTEDEDGDLDDEMIELFIDIEMSDIALHNPGCVFWNFSRDGETGGFDGEGISDVDFTDDGNTLSCFSTHLTSFAVLVDATGNTKNSGSTPALSIVSYVGCGISIVCLSLSILLLLVFRKRVFSQVRHFVHINLSAALLIGLIVFVSGIEAAYDSRVGCLTVAILLHYFFLAAFSWMLCEAIVLLIVVEFVFYEGFFISRKFFVPLGWGLPVPIVAISAAVSHEHYGIDGRYLILNEVNALRRCWISDKEGAIWAFLGPMLFIILINSTVYIIIVHQVFKTKHDAKTVDEANIVESVKTSLKAAAVLLPLLGMTWVFGLLAVNNDTIAFAWIFTILNSLQGFFIFLFYVVKNKKFLSTLKKWSASNYTSTSAMGSLNKASTTNSSEDKAKTK